MYLSSMSLWGLGLAKDLLPLKVLVMLVEAIKL